MPTWLIVTLVLVSVIVFFNRNSFASLLYHALTPLPVKQWLMTLATNRFVADITVGSADRLINVLGEKVAERFEAERQNFYPKLRAEIATLRKERDDLKEGWIDIPVCVWGMRAREGDKNHYSGIVQYSQKEQRIRAHPSPAKRKLTPIRDNYGAIARESSYFPLGAPLYFKVEDTPTQVVMLGQTYTLD